MTSRSRSERLRPALQEAEEELARRLQEACEEPPARISEESTGELLRLDEALLSAARAAEDAIALRRRIRDSSASQHTREGEAPARRLMPDPSDAGENVREFADFEGRPWRAWAVTSASLGPERSARAQLGEYQKGWLAFEDLDGNSRRRLLNYPADWSDLSDDELARLLQKATEAPPRRTGL